VPARDDRVRGHFLLPSRQPGGYSRLKCRIDAFIWETSAERHELDWEKPMDRDTFKQKYDKLSDDAESKRQLIYEFYDEHAGKKNSWDQLCDPYFLNKHYSTKTISINAATQKGIARSAGGAHNALSTQLTEKYLMRVLTFIHSEMLNWHSTNSLDHWRYYLIPVTISVSDTKIVKADGGVLASTSNSKGERIFGLNPHALLGHYGGDTNTNEPYFIMGKTGNWLNAQKQAAKANNIEFRY
jgi:hypothetical protein